MLSRMIRLSPFCNQFRAAQKRWSQCDKAGVFCRKIEPDIEINVDVSLRERDGGSPARRRRAARASSRWVQPALRAGPWGRI